MRSERVALGLVVLAAALAGACARTSVESPVLSDPRAIEDEVVFWEMLETRAVVTNDDALHALLLLVGRERGEAAYEQRVEVARELGWLRGQPPPADESASVGTVAVAACRIMGIEGGLTMRMLGPSPRYATRELVFLGYLPRRSENESLSGLEFLDLLGRIQDEVAAHEADEPG